MEENNSRKVFLSVLGVAILIVAVVGISYAAWSLTKTSTNTNSIATGTITTTYTQGTNGLSITNALPVSDATGTGNTTASEYFDFSVTTTAEENSGVVINYTITATPKAVNESIVCDPVGSTTRVACEAANSGAGVMTSGTGLLKTDEVKVYLATVANTTETQVLAATKLSAMTPIASGNRAGSYTLATGAHTYNVAGTGTFTTNYRFKMFVASDADVNNWDTAEMTYIMTINVDATALPLA